MSHLHFCGWRPLITQTLLGGAVLYSTLTSAYAEDKSPAHPSNNRVHERVARVERASPKVDSAPRTLQTNQNVNSHTNLKFQPDFSRGGHRGNLTPAPVNRAPVNLPPVNRRIEAAPAGGTPRIALLDKRNDKNNEKPPKVEKPQAQPKEHKPEQPQPPRNPQPKPPVIEAPKVVLPKVEKPHVDLPRPEPRIKTDVRPKVDFPKPSKVSADGNQPNVDKPNRGNPSDQPIRIKKPLNEKPNLGVDPAAGKIKIRTPQPDVKVNHPVDKNVGKPVRIKDGEASPGKDVGSKDKEAGKGSGRSIDKSVRLKDGETLTRDHHDRIKLDLDKQHRDLVNKGQAVDHAKIKLPPQIKTAGHDRLQKLPRESLKLAVPKNGKIDPAVVSKLKLRPAHEVLNTRLKNGDFKHLANMKGGQQFQLHKQFEFRQKGDLSRRLNLVAGLQHRGGWRHRFFGPISPIYSRHCRSMWYAGPSFCSPYVWYPSWSPWVDWCWWDTCAPIYDPRPIYCQPVVYDPCSPWVAWNFPTWQPLPYVTCGTWVDVDPVVINVGNDLQLLATRFVDPGHQDRELGSRFRVWVRNNSSLDLNQGFNVLLIASTDANAYAGLPEAGVRVMGLRAGETQAIDIRLPYAANSMGRDSEGHAIPFTYLTALVDSHNELPETNKANNGATLIRGDILPVDPAAFAADPSSSQSGGIIHVAGEGLGPEPGQAMVVIGDQEFQAEIVGWFDLGVQIRLPNFDLDSATAADLVIIRGDGAASNPLTIEIDPTSSTLPAPVPELPEPPPLPEPMF